MPSLLLFASTKSECCQTCRVRSLLDGQAIHLHNSGVVPVEVIAVMPKLVHLGVSRLGVFGSVARGEARPGSDLDVLVEFTPGRKSFDSFCETAEILEKAVGRRVDLVTTESLSPYLAPHILQEVEYVDLGS